MKRGSPFHSTNRAESPQLDTEKCLKSGHPHPENLLVLLVSGHVPSTLSFRRWKRKKKTVEFLSKVRPERAPHLKKLTDRANSCRRPPTGTGLEGLCGIRAICALEMIFASDKRQVSLPSNGLIRDAACSAIRRLATAKSMITNTRNEVLAPVSVTLKKKRAYDAL